MSLYRNIVWYARGLKLYTRSGYENAAKDFRPEDLQVDLQDTSAIVTGANSGIGKVCATELAKRGATVHIVCRSETRGKEAQKEIQEVSKNENVLLHLLDMSKPKDVVQFVRDFQKSHGSKPLDILINNAGCMVNERTVDENGLEANFATNTLATFMLTEGLLPLLNSTKRKPRVITVSSGGMLVQKLDYSDFNFQRMNPFDGTMAYAQNKRQQVVMTELWAAKHPEIFFASMHPGWADTPAVATSLPEFRRKMDGKLRTPEQGADTAVWLSLAEVALTHPSGGFYEDRKMVKTHLPLAWTDSNMEEKEGFLNALKKLSDSFNQ